MKYFLEIFITIVLIYLVTVQCGPLKSSAFRHTRIKRGRTTEVTVTTTQKPEIALNNLSIGECGDDDKLIYIDDTKIESNNSTLSGVIEIYLDTHFKITCTKVLDQLKPGTGAVPSYNSGGQGENFIKINVEGKYGHGIHFKVIIFGKPHKSESEIAEN